MATALSRDRRSRGPRRTRETSPGEAPRGRFVSESHKRLLQIGSAAAAIGSVLALVFTLGDRASGLLAGDEGGPRVSIDSVKLETMPLRTYLVTKKGMKLNSKPPGFSPKELRDEVLVVKTAAEFTQSSKGVSFPATLTLEARGDDGRIVAVDEPLHNDYVLDDSPDTCGCYEYFFLPPRGREYRVTVQVLRPNAPPGRSPLDEEESEWLPL